MRWTNGTLPTGYRFTGQNEESGIQLYDYKARYYSPYLARFISPDTMVSDLTSFMEFSRYGYCLGNPLGYVDPTGHQISIINRPGGTTDITNWSGLAKAAAFAWTFISGGHYEVHYESGKTVEGVEALVTLRIEGEFRSRGVPLEEPSKIVYRGPSTAEQLQHSLLSAMMVDTVVAPSGFVRAVPEDQVGTSQPFKTNPGEDGVSVFEDVLPEEVLAELPGKRVPNTTATIPKDGLPPGTQVIPTEAEQLSRRLSEAHRILVRPEGWSVKRFARALKKLVGWE